MIEIEKPRIETEELTEDGKYGKFVLNRSSVVSATHSATSLAPCAAFRLLKAVLLHQSD